MKRLLFLHIILLLCTLSRAQNVATGFPYECGFEESEDLSAWNLNVQAPANATDKWIFGTDAHSAGRRSMYISAYGDGLNYGGKKNITISYLRYKFPTSTQNQKYDISFDWKGQGDSTISKLYVMVCLEDYFLNNPANNPRNINNILALYNTGRLSNQTINACEQLGESGERFVCGSEAWQNVSLTNEVSVLANRSTMNFAIVFIWVNENQQDSLGRTSIAIDNVQINSASIKKPTNVAVYPQCEDSSLLVTWESGLPTFDIEYRKVGEENWAHGRSGISDGMEGFVREDGTNCSYALKPILEGAYDVRIRGRHDELQTNYVYVSQVLVYCPDNHCVNYINLDGPDVVCTTGFFPDYYGNNETPYDVIGKVDFGPDAVESRHTIHVDPTEVDPRTDSLLKTVPEGSLASVRLGNWNWGGEAESVTYTIHVDSFTQGILLVKYAVVFEDPGHEDEPEFDLEILKPDGTPFEDLCGQAKFTYSDAVEDGWNMSSNNHVAWKDWTTVGVPIMQYHGQDIKVRFTTMDCGMGGHFGYAYFTVDCANAHIETENCGSDAHVTCVAPEGFRYLWYKDDDITNVVATTRTVTVDASGGKYTCRAIFIEEDDCYFEISTVSDPRFPVAEYTYEPVFANCSSKIRFTNTSHVMTILEDGSENHTAEKCSESEWVFRSLNSSRTPLRTTIWNPEYLCDDTGDSVEVTVTSYIGADNSCFNTRVDTIVMPNIIPESTEIRRVICPEETVKFGNDEIGYKYFNSDTVYSDHFTNFAGCDSVSTLYLKVHPVPEEKHIHEAICSDQAVIINGVRYNQPLDDYPIMLKTVNGCDSAIYLTLTVNTRLEATIPQPAYACADDGQFYISYDIHAGVYDSLEIRFSTPELRDTMIYDRNVNSIAIPYPETITPGQYMASLYFYQFCCGVRKEERLIEVRYSSSIVEQKWNDVLTMLAPKYNGGYEFTAFQWYKDNMPIPGENHSYLYQPLDYESEYYVVATRKDGVSVATCPIQPVYREQQSEYPSIVKVGQRVPMYMAKPADIWYYTVSGQLYSTTSLMEGYNTLEVPSLPGVYILKSVNRDGETKAQVMIVEQ